MYSSNDALDALAGVPGELSVVVSMGFGLGIVSEHVASSCKGGSTFGEFSSDVEAGLGEYVAEVGGSGLHTLLSIEELCWSLFTSEISRTTSLVIIW